MAQKKSNLVPNEMQQKYEDIMTILKDFCRKNLNEEYLEACCYLCAALCRKRPSPLLKGKANTWACGIIHAIGTVNFLFDPSQDPHMSASELYNSFGISSSTGSSKSKEIRDMFGMAPFDPDWTLKSKMDDNPMVWMVMVNGFAMDVRKAPREIQKAAFRKGLIPYIPGEKAIEQLKEMLKLNSNDNQGVRYTLINWLIEEDENEYLAKLLKEYEDDIRADFQYGRSLYYFVKGDMIKADKYLNEAMKQNPNVPYYLIGYKRIPRNLPAYIGLGE